ncbi:hypothetical protein K1T71_010275 [Dendrolimus kikuchii]|uniref:Uncharacterized protein n=1 Tax=Dendrolimus kikuchii TaxID=765133 RepID=A0ACC1CRU6_9NEOP|nr:hypothetical protein K1T71_010275 [Dendrolimus kikuchii]
MNLAQSQDNDDPIEAAKRMVSNIQQLVGVHNVFGDKKRNFSAFSVFSMTLFGGTFLYVGSFSQLIYLVQVYPNKVESFKVMNCLSATLVPFSKYIFMMTSRTRLRNVFEMSSKGLSLIPQGSNAYMKMMQTFQRGRYASWFVIVNQIFSHVTYLLMPFLLTIFGNHRYLPTTPGDSYGLTPKYETPFYEATFILTSIATAFSAINQTGYIVLFIALLNQELGHFYVVTETLKDICNELEDKEKKHNENSHAADTIEDKLKFCFIHHLFLIRYHNEIQRLYKMIFGAHFLMMTIVLVTTLQTLNSWDMATTILTAATGILPLFIYCFGGELLISAGLEMSKAVYFCGWESMNAKQARIVSIMLCLSQRPLYLTAADIFVMNRETFGKIVQVVYKIYAVFN